MITYNPDNSPVKVPKWIDYSIVDNTHGVMKVLSDNGYKGYLAPLDEKELYEAVYHFIEQKGNIAIKELKKAHPDTDLFTNNFSNLNESDLSDTDKISLLQKENKRLKNILTFGLIAFAICIFSKEKKK